MCRFLQNCSENSKYMFRWPLSYVHVTNVSSNVKLFTTLPEFDIPKEQIERNPFQIVECKNGEGDKKPAKLHRDKIYVT